MSEMTVMNYISAKILKLSPGTSGTNKNLKTTDYAFY